MNIPRLAWRGLRREWRSGELSLLSLALVLAVAAVTAVGFFTDRVDQALRDQGTELLAADLVVESGTALDPALADQARRLGLATARTLGFPSVVLGAGAPQLVQVKAVDPGYPLRGRLWVRRDGAGAAEPVQGPPAPGNLWVEPGLLALLPSQLGAELALGQSRLRLAGLIQSEPDRGGHLFQIAPRVLLGLDDLPATGLVTPASRVEHRLLVAGDGPVVERFRAWVKERLPPNARLLGLEDARPELRAALDRGSRFLGLASLVTVLVAGAAVALASRRLLERQADALAIQRCLGASSGLLRRLLLARLALLLALAGTLGCLLGLVAHWVLAELAGDWLAQNLPWPSPRPALIGLATGALTLFGFALPALLRLPRVPPLRVLRRDLGPPAPGPWLVGLSAFGALAVLLVWQAGDAGLAGWVLGATLVLVLLLGGAGMALVWVTSRLQRRVRGIGRLGLAALARQPGTTALQLGGFGLGIMALLLLAVVRLDLLAAWQRALPPDTPNRFLINIQPAQQAELQEFLDQQGISGSGLHPMVRGRLTRINERAVDPAAYANPRAQRLAEREFNLSWGIRYQADNQLAAGTWWSGADAPPQFSVETGIADTLGIRLGDELGFWVAGQEVRAPVTSLRRVRWDSFNVNFFVVGTPGLLQDQPATYVTSLYLPPGREALAADLVRRFPGVTLLDVSALMGQVRGVMERGAAAVEYVFIFTLAAGLLVLVAGVQAGAEGRKQEAAVLRTLGARGRQLLAAAALEQGALGLLATLLGAGAAALTGWLLARQVFELDYQPDPLPWLLGIGGATMGIALAGWLATWPLVKRPPLESLRRGD